MSAQPERSNPATVPLRAVWGDISTLPVLAANQFLLQAGQLGEGGVEALVLSVGHVAPPAVSGSAEEQRAALEAIADLPIRALGRYSVTPQQVRELAGIFKQAVELLDKAQGDPS
jgi:hypothetical protein